MYELILLAIFVGFFVIAIPMIALFVSFRMDKRERALQAKEQESHILRVIKENSEAISRLTVTLENTLIKKDETLDSIRSAVSRIHERIDIHTEAVGKAQANIETLCRDMDKALNNQRDIYVKINQLLPIARVDDGN